MKIGRNSPCPCGSGKKYKKCCLRKEQELEAERASEREPDPVFTSTLAKAATWAARAEDRLPPPGAWVEGLLDEDAFDRFADLLERDEEFRDTVFMMDMDRLMADAMVEGKAVDGRAVEGKDGRVRVGDLIRGTERLEGFPKPVYFESEERLLFDAILEAPLRPWRVENTRPQEGLIELCDELDGRKVTLFDRAGSRSVSTGQVVLTRPYPRDGEIHEVGGIWGLPAVRWVDDVWSLREAAPSLEPTELADRLRAIWVTSAVPGLPQLQHGATGGALLFVGAHYDVHDWSAVEERLDAEVERDPDGSRAWVLVDDAEADMGSVVAHIEVPDGRADRLVLRCMSRKATEQSRAWFEELVGEHVTFRVEEIEDVGPMLARRAEEGPSESSEELEIPPEEMTGLIQRTYERIYANYFDEPVPALGGLTPGRALATVEGREQVESLIRSYEDAEREQARQQGRAPADYSFLWAELRRRVKGE